jgi:type I thyroxine 5'-deiodinase
LQIPDGVERGSVRTANARVDFATTCVTVLDIKIPALVDKKDNSTERAYTGWPSRIYLIGADGRVRFKGAPSPYGFFPKQLEEAINSLPTATTT